MNKNSKTQAESLQKVFTFNKSNAPIRVQVIDNEPWFVAKDVCDCLGLINSRQALDILDEDENLTYLIDTSGQRRNMNMVSESGLYRLIFQSRKPEARAFRKWVTRDVLPSIRQRGSYTSLPKLRHTTLNGRRLYPYRQLCQKISGTPGGSYYAYKRRYPGQFVEFDGITYCSEEFGRLLLLNKGVRTYREELHAVQPVLPLNFGESLFLLNASERDINSESGRRNIEQLGRK